MSFGSFSAWRANNIPGGGGGICLRGLELRMKLCVLSCTFDNDNGSKILLLQSRSHSFLAGQFTPIDNELYLLIKWVLHKSDLCRSNSKLITPLFKFNPWTLCTLHAHNSSLGNLLLLSLLHSSDIADLKNQISLLSSNIFITELDVNYH